MINQFPYSFCLITDFQLIPEERIKNILNDAIAGGVDLVQYRDTGAPLEISIKKLRLISEIAHSKKTALIVNTEFKIPRDIAVDGFHVKSKNISQIPMLRKEQGYKKLIGASVHNECEIIEAEKNGADYLILSPLFSPGSKKESFPPIFPQKFKELSNLTKIPILALGGITLENVDIPMQNGATGVAMITGLLRADNIYLTAYSIKEKIDSYRAGDR